VVASSRHAADDLVRASCDTALLGVERYTLRELVYAISSERMNALGLSPISGVARDVLAAQVARRAKLGVLRESAGFPGFPRALARTLRDLRLERVPPRSLRDAGRTGRDLAAIGQKSLMAPAARTYPHPAAHRSKTGSCSPLMRSTTFCLASLSSIFPLAMG